MYVATNMNDQISQIHTPFGAVDCCGVHHRNVLVLLSCYRRIQSIDVAYCIYLLLLGIFVFPFK